MELVGVTKSNSSNDYAMLEYCIRNDLKPKAPRVMAVLDPIKLVIDNYPEGQVEYLDAMVNMENPDLGYEKVPFERELWIVMTLWKNHQKNILDCSQEMKFV